MSWIARIHSWKILYFSTFCVSIESECNECPMIRKLRDKSMYCKSQSWSFLICLKVVQSIIEPIILYYLSLLPETKKGFALSFATSSIIVVEKEGRDGDNMGWWSHLITCKCLGELIIN